MNTAINTNAIAAVALLSNYNFFTVNAENAKDGKPSSFCATGINIDKHGYMTFERQFSQPCYSFGAVVDVAATDEDKFSFLTTAGTVYTVDCKNKALADCSTASGSKDDPASLIDWSRSHIDNNGNMLVVLDLRKLGVISNKRFMRVKHYMNAFLGGLSVTKQVCRTIYFEVASNQQITVGLYNLEQEQKMTALPVDLEISYTEDESEKIRHMLEVAREELEVIPQF